MSQVLTPEVAVEDKLRFEKKAIEAGYQTIAGLDEAGRGPLAGPVVAACVILPEDTHDLQSITDSKKLSPGKRQEFYMLLHERARSIGVGVVDAQTIDKINILQATYLAMERAVKSMSLDADFLLIDGNRLPGWANAETSQTIVSGDSLSLSIASASIIAKVTRDKIMDDYEHLYPEWGFGKHKGYGTAAHLTAIREKGICDIHRKSFAPISQMELMPG